MSGEVNNYQIKIKGEAGTTLIDLLIALTVIGIAVSVAMVRMGAARDRLRLTNSAQVLSASLDKARLAAIRCHCSISIQIFNTGSYSVTGPLTGSAVETINHPLEPTVTFQGLTLPLTITFDRSGRTDQDYHLTMWNRQGSRRVDLSGNGDLKLDGTPTRLTPARPLRARAEKDATLASF